MDLKNNIALVTGGASGLGRGTVEHFVSRGCKVAILDINDEKAKDVIDLLGEENVSYFNTDVMKEESVKDAGVLTDYGSGNEFDVYLGYATEVNGIGVDLGYVSFKYPGITAYDFEEIVLGLSMGDFGITYANATTSGFGDYLEFSYAIGAVGLSYGQYDMGDNLLVSYGFSWII